MDKKDAVTSTLMLTRPKTRSLMQASCSCELGLSVSKNDAVPRPLLLTVRIAYCQFNCYLKDFIHSIILFSWAFDVLCPHWLSHSIGLRRVRVKENFGARGGRRTTSWNVIGAWPWVRRMLIARALCRKSDLRPTRRTGVFGQKCLTSGYH